MTTRVYLLTIMSFIQKNPSSETTVSYICVLISQTDLCICTSFLGEQEQESKKAKCVLIKTNN